MSGQDLIDFRLDKLEKSDEKKTEILSEIATKIAVLQTKLMFLVGGATIVINVAIYALKKMIGE